MSTIRERLLRLTVLGPGSIVMAGALVFTLLAALFFLDLYFCLFPNPGGGQNASLSRTLLADVHNSRGEDASRVFRIDFYRLEPGDHRFPFRDELRGREPILTVRHPGEVRDLLLAMAESVDGPDPLPGKPIGPFSVWISLKNQDRTAFHLELRPKGARITFPPEPCQRLGNWVRWSPATAQVIKQHGLWEPLAHAGAAP